MAELDGKVKNKKILEFLNGKMKDLTDAGRANSSDSVNTIVLDPDTDTRILEDDKEVYDSIMELRNYLERNPLVPEETYVIPGVKMYSDQGISVTTMCIPKSDIKKLVDILEKGAGNAQDFYRDYLGIEFPAQVYQLQEKYNNSTIPGTDVPVPGPRLLSESPEEYEERLEAIYNGAGLDREEIANSNIRAPYAHEQVNYAVSDEQTNGFQSEYYDAYRRREARRGINPNGPEPQPVNHRGEGPIEVRESEDYDRTPLREKIGSFLNITATSFKSKSIHQKLKVLAGIGAVTAGGIFVLTTPPLQPLVVLGVGIAAVYAGIKKATKFSEKHLAPRMRNFFFGRKREDEPELEEGQQVPTQGSPQPQPTPQPAPGGPGQQPQGGGQQQPGTGGTPVPQPQPGQGGPTGGLGGTGTPTGEPDEYAIDPQILEGFVRNAQLDLDLFNSIDREITIISDEISQLAGINPNDPAILLKQQRLVDLKNQLRGQLAVINQSVLDFKTSLEQETLSEGRTHGHN